MGVLKPITIVGGGLAGLALGIGLRQRKVPVTVYEAGRYPRHRVCGEFISGRGQQVLSELGLDDRLREAGAIPAKTAMFRVHLSASPVRPLPMPAISISRFALDDLLARGFQELGGDLIENCRWRGDELEPGIVKASGRRLQPVEDGWRWFGLKVHASNVVLEADLEMHACRYGYVGLSRLAAGEVNVCGIFRRCASEPKLPSPPRQLLHGPPGSLLHQRLSSARIDETSACAVAGLPLNAQRAADLPGCCIGDALTMIAPVTGNGMSMALEAAQISIGPLAAYSMSECSWPEAVRRIAGECDTRFARRLRWGQWVHALMFLPLLRRCRADFFWRSQLMWNMFFERTR